jgi:hypothetical protein
VVRACVVHDKEGWTQQVFGGVGARHVTGHAEQIQGTRAASQSRGVALSSLLRCIGARNWVGEPVAGSRQCTVCLAHAVTSTPHDASR